MNKGQRAIYCHQVWNANSVTKNTNESSAAIDLRSIAHQGFFSLQYEITGSGTAKFEYLLCNQDSGTDFLEPSSASDIASGLTATSGPGANGKDIVAFSPEPSRWLKIKVTETGTSAAVVVSVWLVII